MDEGNRGRTSRDTGDVAAAVVLGVAVSPILAMPLGLAWRVTQWAAGAGW